VYFSVISGYILILPAITEDMQNMTDKYSGPKLISIDGDKTDPAVDFDTEPDFEKNDIKKTARTSITAKQRNYVNALLSGSATTQSEAYKMAYDVYDSEGRQTMGDHAIGVEASKLMHNPRIANALKIGYDKQTASAQHSAVSARKRLDDFFIDKMNNSEVESIQVRSAELYGKSETVGYFLDRSQDLTANELSEQEVREQLEDKLKRAFDQ
jgi:hypothetical protein